MSLLTQEDTERIRHYLEKSGLIYEPLKAELMDHLISDLERRMEEGMDRQQAWEKVVTEIPDDHFKSLQVDVMLQINKKTNTLKILTGLSFLFLIVASLFKLMHLAGAAVMLIMGLASMVVTIGVSMFNDFSFFLIKKGRSFFVLLAAMIILFISFLILQPLHNPIVPLLSLIAVPALMVLFPLVSVYCYKWGQSMQDHPLVLLLNNNGRYIQYAVMTLIGSGFLFTLSSLISAEPSFHISLLFFSLALAIAAFYAFSSSWKQYVLPLREGKGWRGLLLLSSVVSFTLFMLPPLVGELRKEGMLVLYLSALVYAGILIVHYIRFSEDTSRFLLAGFCTFNALLFILRISLLFGLLDQAFMPAILAVMLSPQAVISFLAMFIIFYRKPLFSTYMLLVISLHMFDFTISSL